MTVLHLASMLLNDRPGYFTFRTLEAAVRGLGRSANERPLIEGSDLMVSNRHCRIVACSSSPNSLLPPHPRRLPTGLELLDGGVLEHPHFRRHSLAPSAVEAAASRRASRPAPAPVGRFQVASVDVAAAASRCRYRWLNRAQRHPFPVALLQFRRRRYTSLWRIGIGSRPSLGLD
jgi:hypothetical protein